MDKPTHSSRLEKETVFLREHSYHSREFTPMVSKEYLELETMTPSICNDVRGRTHRAGSSWDRAMVPYV